MKRPKIEKIEVKTKPVLVTSLQPKDEALRAAAMFLERFTGINLRTPTQNESAPQYRAYVLARLQPIISNAESVRKVVRAGIQS